MKTDTVYLETYLDFINQHVEHIQYIMIIFVIVIKVLKSI